MFKLHEKFKKKFTFFLLSSITRKSKIVIKLHIIIKALKGEGGGGLITANYKR